MTKSKTSKTASALLAWVLATTMVVVGFSQTVPVAVVEAGPLNGSVVPSYSRRVLNDGPVGYWGFDETAGTTAFDSGPNEIEAQYRGDMPGSFSLGNEPAVGAGGSVFLNGQDGFVYVADSWTDEAQTLAPQEELSIELWFKPEALSLDNQNHILARWRWYGWQLRVFNNQIWGDLWEETAAGDREYTSLQGPTLTTDEWYHVVLTKDADDIKLFVNGTEVGSAASQGDAFYEVVDPDVDCCGTGGGVGFGRDADVPVWYFQGLLDEVAVYDKALPAANVEDHHTVGVAADERLSETHGDQEGAQFDADPVHTGTGSLWLPAHDLDSGALAPVSGFARSYNSRDERSGVLGRGWTTTLDSRVSERGDDVMYVAPDGRTTRYVANGAGGWDRPAGVYADLVQIGDEYELRFRGGETHRFDSDGRLALATDWAGQTMTVVRDEHGLASAMSWSTGQLFDFAYSADDQLTSITADDGRQVTYGYTNRELTAVTDPTGASVTYAWSTDGYLETILDKVGVEEAFSVYDDAGRVLEQRTPDGNVTFAYDDAALTTVVTNVEAGEAVTYIHDDLGRATSIIDPNGMMVTIALDADGQLLGTVDRLGFNPSATYDDNGDVTSVIDPVRGTSTFVYDSDDRLIEMTEPTGAVTAFTYDGNERTPSTITDALGDTSTFDIVDGLVAQVTDADGVTASYTYNDARRTTSMTNGLGDTWTYTYDSVGRQTSSTTPLGHTASSTFDDEGRMLTSTAADGGITSYTYDQAGRLSSMTDPVGAVTSHSYDNNGDLATTTDPEGRVTTYTYDDLGQLIAVAANDGGVSETDYGVLGRVVSSRDSLGREMTYTYDADGNRTEVIAPDGGVTRTEYDTAGRVAALEDPIGRRTSHFYDEFGRLITVMQPDGTQISYAYDLLGRQTETIAPDGGVTATEFTPAGRITSVTNPVDGVTSYDYDAAGQMDTVTDPNGFITSYAYDPDGRRTSVTTPEGLVTTWEYDPMARVTKMIDPAGVEVTLSYTLRGEVETEQREGDGVVNYAYNLDGTMASVADALGNTTTFTYDDAGRQTTRIDATGAVEVMEYNTAGELVAKIDRLGQRTDITYDSNGRIDTMADPSGRTTDHDYDTAGQLLARQFGDGTTISYDYDDLGRRTQMVDPTGTTTYSYDANGRPIEVAAPNGTLGYTYDLAGRRTELTYPDGTTATYDYDAAGRLTGLTDPNTGDVDYTLDDDGRLVLTELPNGETRSFDFVNGQMVSHQDHGRVTNLTYNESGRIATLSGAENHTYTYDQAGQLTQAVQDEGTYAYTYGTRGEITSISDPDRSRTFTHNANVEIDTIIDNNANTGSAIYDQAGRMIEHADPDGTTTIYNYDARGLLTTTTIQPPESTDDRCTGLTPTIVGTAGDDILSGTNGDDIIVGLGGNDTINGGNGTDIICGGPGNDTINDAGNGKDIVDGGPGNDQLFGGNGKDTLTGGPGDDQLFGGNGKDTLDGGPGTDTADGGKASDVCTNVEQTINCETINTTDGPDNTGGTSSETRTYDGASALTTVEVDDSDGTTSVDQLLWDPTMAIPQIVEWTTDATSDNLIHGYQGEIVGDDWAQYGAFGNSLDGGDTWTPFGPTDPADDISFGYRGELETTTGVFLRARDLNSQSGVFVKRDPLPGVLGTPTLTNPYHYADNDPTNKVDPLGLRPTDFVFVETLLSACGSPVTRTNAARRYTNCRDGWQDQQAAYAALDGMTIESPPICRSGSGVEPDWGDLDYVAAWSDDCYSEELKNFNDDLKDRLSEALGFAIRIGISFLPGGDCVLVAFDLATSGSASGWDAAGCLLDAAGVGIGYVAKGDNFATGTARVCRVYNSFSANTEVVLGDGTTAPISSLQVGDLVWATDPTTGEAGPQPVEAVWPHIDDLVDLVTSAGSVTTTEDHEMWNATDQEWQETQHLEQDDLLLASDGTHVTVEGLDWTTQHNDIAYDLTVTETHTYHVVIDTTDILVHNCNTGGAGPVRVGQAGETAVRSVYDIGPKVTVSVNGRTRILDGLTDEAVTEVKNVRSLSLTEQIRDNIDYAAQTGRRLDLFVRPSTTLSTPLLNAISQSSGGIVIRYIP